jgi:DNA-directed RNA polymerase II subunit RPB11
MNAQERYEKFVLPEDVSKVSVKLHESVSNAVYITVEREDHTIGNLIRHQLHRDPEVQFAGYKVEHPLEHRVLFHVKSVGETKPLHSFKKALRCLNLELDDIKQQFEHKTQRV